MKYVAYYRVSTKKQGESQLGLKAQKHAVERFISPDLIDAEFTEIETGTNKRYRPILNEAIELCAKTGATLIIAKLDRLARNVSFVSSLMDSKVKFKAVDMPEESIKHKAKHNPHNKRALAFVRSLNYADMKLRQIAEQLNENGFKTSTGKDFATTQVIRVLAKLPSKD